MIQLLNGISKMGGIALILMHLAPPAHAINYYVSAGGNNANSGLTVALAKRTINAAAQLTTPGDTIFVMNGTYSNPSPSSNVVDIRISGTPSQWITYKAYPGHKPLIKSKNWAAIAVQGADYIVIDGFKIVGNADSVTLAYAQSQQSNTNNPITSGNGINIAAEYQNASNLPHHITVRNCRISKCPGGGIATTKADYLRIENNLVSECSWYAPYGNSGISLFKLWNSDTSTATKNYVIGNTLWRNENYIKFISQGAITDGNGIIIDYSRQTTAANEPTAYKGKTYVANNVAFANGGRGIHCYNSDNVTIVNNTCYQNCQSPAIRDGDFTSNRSGNISFINNISSPSPGIKPIGVCCNSTNILVSHNLWAESASLATPQGANTVTGAAAFLHASLVDSLANFRLSGTSPALNRGMRSVAPLTDRDGYLRLRTDSVDLGAYEAGNRPVQAAPKTRPKTGLLLFPNPATDKLWFNLDRLVTPVQVKVWNSLGQSMALPQLVTLNGEHCLETKTLKPGTYYLTAYQGDNQVGQGTFLKAE